MSRARQALIMAAGRGSRLSPFTDAVPKPLLPVRGTSFLENTIDALHKNDIRDIHVVTGYREEAFESIARRFSDVRLIHNPYHETCNNISSLYVAQDFLEDAIILDGDLWFQNPEALSSEFGVSCYAASITESTNEWLLQVRNGLVTSCSRTGGERGYRLWSVSLWTAEDGRRLRDFVRQDFMRPENRSLYWDDIPLFLHPDAFSLSIREIGEQDVVEIDTVEELLAFDPQFLKEPLIK